MTQASNSSSLQPNQRMWDTLTHIIALNRSAQYLQEKEGAGQKLNQLAPAHMRAELEKMFYEVHTRLYQDTHSAEQYGVDRAGNVVDSAKRIEVRYALHAMADDLCDANARAVGMPKENLADIYAKHYVELRKVVPFKYGNQLTLSTFFTAVSQIPFEKNIEGTSIDFRRLDESDLSAFKPNNTESLDIASIKTAFIHALDSSRDSFIPNQRAKADMLSVPGDKLNQNKLAKGELQNARILQGWPDKTVEIAGVPFLGVEGEDHQLKLVTVTGGLVDYEIAKEQIDDGLKSNKLIDELPKFQATQYLQGYQPPQGKIVVDGFEVDGANAPLVCLDVNLLTGLRSVAHQQFVDEFKKYSKNKEKDGSTNGQNMEIFYLRDPKNREEFLSKLDKESDPKLYKICEVACQHIAHLTEQLNQEVNTEVAGKMASENPVLVLSMGGSGAGKGIVTQHIKKLVAKSGAGEENFVKASLDDYRSKSQLYKVMQAAGHHADDYSLVEPFANTLRSWVTKRAMENNLNILYDGSAIPYKGRYDELIDTALAKTISVNGGNEQKAKKIYQVDVCAADAQMDIPDAARAQNTTSSVVERVLGRFHGAENRCLPWGVTLSKHTEAMRSFLEAAEDSRVQHVYLFNTDGKPEQAYLSAYAYTVPKPSVKQVKESLQSVDPARYRELLGARGISEDAMAKIPHFVPENIGYTLRMNKGDVRALVITDMQKMVQMAEKGLQNSYASDLDALHYRTSKLAGVVPSPQLRFVQEVQSFIIDRVQGVAGELSKVLNYVVPASDYQEAVSNAREKSQTVRGA